MGTMTISAIKADVGGYVGHCDIHPDLLSEANRRLPMEDMEYTTMPAVAERLNERWESIEELPAVGAPA